MGVTESGVSPLGGFVSVACGVGGASLRVAVTAFGWFGRFVLLRRLWLVRLLLGLHAVVVPLSGCRLLFRVIMAAWTCRV